MTNLSPDNPIIENSERPLLLSSAIALSKLGSGVATIAYLTVFLFYEQAILWIEKLTNSETRHLINRPYILAIAVISLVSFIGVVKMGRNKKSGFFFYLSAQAALIIAPLMYIGMEAFSTTNLIFILLFVLIYSSFYKRFNS